jgi:predicted aspartyl protease
MANRRVDSADAAMHRSCRCTIAMAESLRYCRTSPGLLAWPEDRMFRPRCFGIFFGLISVFGCAQSTASLSSPSKASDSGVVVVPASPAASTPIEQALALYRKGEFDGAIAKYEEVLKDRPKSPDAYAGLVRVYLKQKNVDKAAQAAEEGLAQVDSPRIHVAQAEVWFRQGKIHEAEAEWVKVINSGYPEARAFLGLARVRDAIAMYKSAKGMIDKARELDSYDPDIREEWIGTLSRVERIKYLEASLSGENNWDAEERDNVASYLMFLKARARQKPSSCHLVSKVKPTETPLVRLLNDPQHMRGYGLPVLLNGHKSSLMLDTGASGILVKRSIAERAGISRITETKVGGIGNKGRRDAYIGVVDSIKVGDLEFQNCPVEVMESRSVAGEDGLIGSDVFEDFLVDIDFPKEKLKLSELPKRPGEPVRQLALKNRDDDDSGEDAARPESPDTKMSDPKAAESKAAQAKTSSITLRDRYIAPEMKDYTPVFRFGHDLLVPTSIGKVPYKLFLIDTGAFMNAISPSAAREVTKVHGDSDTIIEGISGRVNKVYSANKAVLQFGHLKQENQDMTAFDTTALSDNAGTEISGFLGFSMLYMLDIKIDYRDALVDFQFDKKRYGR